MMANVQEKVALCADEVCLTHPEMMGLGGENLEAQPWLQLFASAEAARAALRISRDVKEVWVISCAQVAPINLAATLKADRPDRPVYMLTLQGSGSLSSRSVSAGIDGQLSHQAFVARYVQWKERASVAQAAPATESQTAHAAPEQSASAPAASPASAPASLTSPAPVTLTPPTQTSTQFLPVVSGSGGAGKSTISALIAQVAAASGVKTLLLDYDLQFGELARFFGEENPVHIDELLANHMLLTRVSAQTGRPALLAPPARLEDANDVAEQTKDVLQLLSGKFDLVVCNTGAFWAEQHAALLERATKAIFLIDQRSSSLRACQHALDLCARLGIASGPFTFALNKCTKGSPFTAIDASCVLRGAFVHELRDGGPEVDELMESAMMMSLLEEDNVLVEDIRKMLGKLLPTLGFKDEPSDAGLGLAALLGKRNKKRKRSA